jgi:hypothetical protein
MSWRSSFGRAFSCAALLLLGACSHGVSSDDDSSPEGGPPGDASFADVPPAPTSNNPDGSLSGDDATAVSPSGDDDASDDAASNDDANPSGLAPPPTLSAIAPASAIVGTTGPTIVCTGTGYVARSVIQVNGVALATGFVSNLELRATLPTSDLAQVGTLHVTVGTTPPGGGGSAEQTFQVVNPAPTITSLAPTSVLLGSSDTVLTVTGAAFVTGASIAFNGTTLPTTLVSATTAKATVPAAQLATSGTYAVTVTNLAPGGGTSSSIAFTVANPTVTVTSVTPSTLLVDANATSIALVGTGFVAATAVSFNGATISSTFTDGQHMSATVPASALTNAGNFPVGVTNPAPGGGVSTPVQVAVVYPSPTVTSLSPSSVDVGAAPATVTAIGSGYIAGQTSIYFDGVAALTTVADASHASATLTTAQMSPAHTIQVTVTNPSPGGGTSTPALPFTVEDPLPAATAVSPSSAIVGASDTPITITGSGFVPASTVSLGSTPLTTTFVSATSLTSTIPAANLTAAATLMLSVASPAPGGGTSGSLAFVVDNPGPAIASLAPSSTVVPASDTPITVTGTGFVSGVSVVNLGATALATSYGNGTLGATIPAASLGTATTLSITVVNPAPGGGTSNAAFFTANNPAPTLTALSTNAIFAGSAATQVTLTGTNFVAGSIVKINGTTVASTINGATSITTPVSAALLATPTTLNFTVTNLAPGGGTSGTQSITVSCNTAGADIVLSALNTTTTETLNLGTPTAYRITTSEYFGAQPDTCPAQEEDTSATEPYRGYVVMNATAQTATLEAWAVCGTTDDGYLTFYSQSTVPTTQTNLESCKGVISEGLDGSGGFNSKSPGTSKYCPGLTKANGAGLSLPACGVAVVLLQAWSTTNTKYTPPTTLAVDLE